MPGSVFAFLNGFGQQGWADMSIMNIEVLAGGKRYRFQSEAGTSLKDCLLKAGILEGAECGGRGICGKCAVKVRSGTLAPVEGDESFLMTRGDGKVLACQSLIREDVVIEISAGRDDVRRKVRLPNLQKEKKYSDSLIEKKFIQLSKPSLRDQASDLERILAQVGKNKKVAFSLLGGLPEIVRKADFEVTAVLVEDELIAVEPGDTHALRYGFILDIGTTTIAVYLVDLLSGEVLDADGTANPQRVFGADVLSRITAAAGRENLEKMQAVTIKGISETMRGLLRSLSIDENHVYSVVAVGNTTMSHLFLGVDPKNLSVAPFIPCYRPRTVVKGGRLGLPMHSEGTVHVLANISGYVGSDTLGVAMATKLWEQKGYSLAVDIGTNGEIILGYKGWLLACSAAAGPAFEGAHIQNGMRAGDGAIESVLLENGTVRLGVIGDMPPQGICGSGLIDAVAELLRCGLLGVSGRLAGEKSPALSQPLGGRLRTVGGMREFVLAFAGEQGNERDSVITQKDIRELQLAKAAIAAGIAVLLKEVKIEASQIDRIYLAGAFGNYLDRKKAVALGMFPGISVDKIIPIGNAAAEGAGLCLLSLGERKMADRIASFVKPVELSTHVEFNDLFVREIGFPPLGGKGAS